MLVFLPQRRLTKLFLTACRNINGLKRVVRSYLHRHTSAFVDFSLCLWTVRHSGCEHTPLLTQHYITHKDSVRTFFQKKNGYTNMVLVLFTLSKFCILGCLVCIVVSCLVCIVVVVLCVFVVLCVCVCVCSCFYFRCRTAGYKSVFGRSCDWPSRHRFFLVSLCL